jgi:hypothetical protein
MKLGRLLTLATVLVSVLLLAGSAGAAVWQVPGVSPTGFPTIQAAIDSSTVHDGDVIDVASGRRLGATVTKAVTIRGVGAATIVGGPFVNALGSGGFLFPGGGQGSGATITGLSFLGVAFPVFSRGADYVSVTDNEMLGPVQGVTNWANGTWGNGWDISRNVITGLRTSCGGGFGILIGDYAGGIVSDNLIAGNTVQGAVRVRPDDCGGYNAPGVVLYADFRRVGDLGATIRNNRVMKNRVYITSTEPALVTVAGVELSDTRDDPLLIEITANAVVYNDLRGMDVPVSLTPNELEPANVIQGNITGPLPDMRGARRPLAMASPVR